MSEQDERPRGPLQSSDPINEIALALAKAQGEMSMAHKSSDNPFFKSKYADLASCIDASREALTKNELAVVQTLHDMVLETTLVHSSGQWFSSRVELKPDKPGPQALGSCLTYMRRYCYAAIVGLAQVDDDGEAATQRGERIVEKADRINEFRKTLAAAANLGTDALRGAWEALPVDIRRLLEEDKETWKERAAIVDESREAEHANSG